MAAEHTLQALGYDVEILAALTHAERHSMRGVATAWLAACVALAAGAGIATWVLAPSVPLAVGISVFMLLLTMNLLRVTTAGGGVAASDSEVAVQRWRPPLAPALVLGILAALLAQPLQLPIHSDELDLLVERYRSEVITEQVAAAQSLGEAGAGERYHRQMGARDFPALRMQLLWRTPATAARWTAMFCLVVLVPAAWAQWMALDATRHYQRERRRRTRAQLRALALRTELDIQEALAAFPGFEPAPLTRSTDSFGRRRVSPWLRATQLSADRPWLGRGDGR